MAQYPIVSFDYPRTKKLAIELESLIKKSEAAIDSLKAIDDLDAIAAQLDESLSEFFSDSPQPLSSEEHEPFELEVAFLTDEPITTLTEALKAFKSEHARLLRICEQAEAWDKYFRDKWQKLFHDRLGVRLTKSEADESFREAFGTYPMAEPAADWIDENGELSIDLEGLFKYQETVEESEDDESIVTLASIEKQIRKAYLHETQGAVKERVLLKDLRPKVGVQSEDFDQALLEMQRQGKVVLMGLDNPMERTPEVEDAALYIAGRPRHLVYFQG